MDELKPSTNGHIRELKRYLINAAEYRIYNWDSDPNNEIQINNKIVMLKLDTS